MVMGILTVYSFPSDMTRYSCTFNPSSCTNTFDDIRLQIFPRLAMYSCKTILGISSMIFVLSCDNACDKTSIARMLTT